MICITTTGPAKVKGTDFLDSRREFRSPTRGTLFLPAYDFDSVARLEPLTCILVRPNFFDSLRMMIARSHLKYRRAQLFLLHPYQVTESEQVLPDVSE